MVSAFLGLANKPKIILVHGIPHYTCAYTGQLISHRAGIPVVSKKDAGKLKLKGAFIDYIAVGCYLRDELAAGRIDQAQYDKSLASVCAHLQLGEGAVLQLPVGAELWKRLATFGGIASDWADVTGGMEDPCVGCSPVLISAEDELKEQENKPEPKPAPKKYDLYIDGRFQPIGVNSVDETLLPQTKGAWNIVRDPVNDRWAVQRVKVGKSVKPIVSHINDLNELDGVAKLVPDPLRDIVKLFALIPKPKGTKQTKSQAANDQAMSEVAAPKARKSVDLKRKQSDDESSGKKLKKSKSATPSPKASPKVPKAKKAKKSDDESSGKQKKIKKAGKKSDDESSGKKKGKKSATPSPKASPKVKKAAKKSDDESSGKKKEKKVKAPKLPLVVVDAAPAAVLVSA